MEGRRKSQEAIVQSDDILSRYISKYTVRGERVPESRARNAYRWLLRVLAIVVGVVAGFPWIQTAEMTGGSSLVLQALIIFSVVVAYGLTTTWAFLQVTDKLKPEPPELYRIKAQKKWKSNIGKHIFSHGFGILSTIPTIYIASIYNTEIFYVPVAGFVAYAFSTLGFYALVDIVSTNIANDQVNHHSTTWQIQHRLANSLSNRLILQLRNGMHKDGIFIRDDERSASADTKALLQLLKSESSTEVVAGASRFNKLSLKLLIPAATLIALVNGVVNGVLTSQAIDFLSGNGAIQFASIVVVVIPLLALDYLATKMVMSSIKDAVINQMLGEKSSSYARHHRPSLYYMAPTVGFVLSFFSALTDTYVTQKAIEKSDLSAAIWLFVINMQLSKTFLETTGVTTVLHDLIEWVDRKRCLATEIECNVIDRINDLSNVIECCDENVFNEFRDIYKEEIEGIDAQDESELIDIISNSGVASSMRGSLI